MAENQINPKMESGWLEQLHGSFQTDSFRSLKQFLVSEKQKGERIFPPASRIFAAFDLTPWEEVRVVILGQDPYHGPGQANGLCFSVNPGVAFPPSLRNIYQELDSDVGGAKQPDGDLSHWARQGVLLLNATLTVRVHAAGSHQKKGWELFTDDVVTKLNHHPRQLVFILWGSYARRKGEVIDRTRHAVIESPHPSPLSAHRGFFGSKPFSQTNQILEGWGQPAIEW